MRSQPPKTPAGNTGSEITRHGQKNSVGVGAFPRPVRSEIPLPRVASSVASGLAPSGGEPGENLSARIALGWLDFTLRGHWQEVHEALDWGRRYAGEWVPRRGSWRGYALAYTSTFGVSVGARRTQHGLEVHFSFPASALERLEDHQLRGLAFFAVKMSKNITRVDASLDDYKKIKTPSQVYRMIRKTPDKLVTRVDLQKSVRYVESDGGTLYLGSPSGSTMLRVYDKSAESACKVDAIRWELQMRNERARDFMVLWLAGGFEKLGHTFSEFLVGFVDFRNRADCSNVTRANRLPWFRGLVGSAQRAKRLALDVLKKDQEINDLRAYFERSCAGLLATLLEASHVDGDTAWLSRVLDYGRSRRNPRQELALLRFKTGLQERTDSLG